MPDPTDDPVHIHRADLTAALDSLAITDLDSVGWIEIQPGWVEVTRYKRKADGHRFIDPLTERPATVTTRIEIR